MNMINLGEVFYRCARVKDLPFARDQNRMELVLWQDVMQRCTHLLLGLATRAGIGHRYRNGYAVGRIEQIAILQVQRPVEIESELVVRRDLLVEYVRIDRLRCVSRGASAIATLLRSPWPAEHPTMFPITNTSRNRVRNLFHLAFILPFLNW